MTNLEKIRALAFTGSSWLPAARRQIWIKKRAAKKPAKMSAFLHKILISDRSVSAPLLFESVCISLFYFMKWTDE